MINIYLIFVYVKFISILKKIQKNQNKFFYKKDMVPLKIYVTAFNLCRKAFCKKEFAQNMLPEVNSAK